MKVTIEGDLKQVTEVLSPTGFKARTNRGERAMERTREREAETEKRRLIRRAFEIVRYGDKYPDEKALLLQALTGKVEISEPILETSRKLCEIYRS